MQLIICYALLTHWHSLPAESGGDVADIIVKRSIIAGFSSTTGKILVYPVLPWLLLSEAMFTYHCVNHSLALIDIALSSVISCAWVYIVLCIESAGNIYPFGE